MSEKAYNRERAQFEHKIKANETRSIMVEFGSQLGRDIFKLFKVFFRCLDREEVTECQVVVVFAVQFVLHRQKVRSFVQN